jgi:hypothetical protein
VTAGDLKKLLSEVPDDALVAVPAPDHEYRAAHAEHTTALKQAFPSNRGYWLTEDHGEELTPEKSFGKRIPVLVFS